MSAVLLQPANTSALKEMLLLAEAIQAEGSYTPVMVLADPGMEAFALGNLPKGVQVRRLYTSGGGASPGASPRPGQKRGLRKMLARWWALAFASTLRQLSGSLQQARAILAETRPAALLVSGDRHLNGELAFLKAAQEAGCPAILVSYAYANLPDFKDLALLRKDDPLHHPGSGGQTLLKRWIRRRYPAQVKETLYGPLLFYTPAVTLALAWMGMLPPNPWVLGAGHTTWVTVTGEEDRRRFADQGVPPGKLRVTGNPSHDGLYRLAQQASELRQALGRKYLLPAERPNLVCAVPHLVEHNLVEAGRHWADTRSLVQALASSGANLLLSLHPKSDPAQYRFLESEYGARILEEPLQEALPAADLFAAGFSTTVLWAVLLGIPAVVIDTAGLGYDIYDHLPGVIKVEGLDRLGPVLARCFNDPDYARSLRQAQADCAAQIAPFDGQACRRIIQLIQASGTSRG